MHELTASAVMVAGGAGFVGSAVVRELLGDGINVVCYDNYLHGGAENVSDLGGSLTVVNGDVLDICRLISAIQEHGVRYIINCVGDTFVPSAYELPQRFFDINLQGTLNVLRAAEMCRVRRVLYVSSTEVYGENAGQRLEENVPLNPLNTYAVSKLAADRLCFTYHVEHKLPVVIARIFNCYGPRETHPYIVPEIISQLSRGSTLSLGNLEAERDLTYVHDTARALISVIASDIPDGEAVNVGSDVSYTVKWLAHAISRLMGRDGVEIRQDPRRFRRLDIKGFRCGNSKLLRYTDWRPKVDIDEGLLRTISWYRDNGCQWSWEKTTKDIRPDSTDGGRTL